MRYTLPIEVESLVPMLMPLDLAIFTTVEPLGFITSDKPCFWFDDQAHKRPPLYRNPALCYESIEIIMPISPTQVAIINRRGRSGYIPVELNIVNAMNRLSRRAAREHFIVNQNRTEDSWFHEAPEPDDLATQIPDPTAPGEPAG